MTRPPTTHLPTLPPNHPEHSTLATASDGGLIILFTLPEGRPAHYWRREVAARKVQAMLVRTAQADIYDLAWSPSSIEFASVSVDNRVCFWQIQGTKAYPAATFTSHQNYVQGVAWDPRDRYIVSQSNDRSCRVYKKREDEAATGKKKSSKKKRPAGPPFTEVSLMRLASRPEDVAKAKEVRCFGIFIVYTCMFLSVLAVCFIYALLTVHFITPTIITG